MTSPALPVHGGDLEAIGRRYGLDPHELLDFSVNLNPLGPPRSLLRELSLAAADVADLMRYPDPDANALRTALAVSLDVEPESVVVGNGAAALLGAALRAGNVRTCVVPTPAFSEDRHAVASARAVYRAVPLDPARGFTLCTSDVIAKIDSETADGCLITNPHNPSGALAPRETIFELASEARRRAATTIVDEAFIDYAAEASISRDAASVDALIAIRSLTKFYAVPALRVGYAVCRSPLAQRIRAEMPSWPVTSLAARALTAALAELAYARESRDQNIAARTQLIDELAFHGIVANPSSANFLLLTLSPEWPDATELTRRLILESKIVVRDCSTYEGLEGGRYIRVAVRSPRENARLVSNMVRVGKGH